MNKEIDPGRRLGFNQLDTVVEVKKSLSGRAGKVGRRAVSPFRKVASIGRPERRFHTPAVADNMELIENLEDRRLAVVGISETENNFDKSRAKRIVKRLGALGTIDEVEAVAIVSLKDQSDKSSFNNDQTKLVAEMLSEQLRYEGVSTRIRDVSVGVGKRPGTAQAQVVSGLARVYDEFEHSLDPETLSHKDSTAVVVLATPRQAKLGLGVPGKVGVSHAAALEELGPRLEQSKWQYN